MSLKKENSVYYSEIDGLRALAVISVVAYHYFPRVFEGGFLGVDIFFVISGYLITSIILNDLYLGRFSFPLFITRRILRIFPALIFVLTSCFLIGWFILMPHEFKQLGKHIFGGAGFISNLLLMKELGYFDVASETKPLLHLWSLGVEMQFYIFWPLILYFFWRSQFNLHILFIFIAFASFYWSLGQFDSSHAAIFYSLFSRIWEFIVGAILASLIMLKNEDLRKFSLAKEVEKNTPVNSYIGDKSLNSNAITILGLGFILYSIFYTSQGLISPHFWALFPTFGAALIIFAGRRSFINRHVFSSKVLIWVGLISYPLYLWHWPLLAFARIIYAKEPSNIVKIGLVTLSIALSWLTFKAIEPRFRGQTQGMQKMLIACVLIAVVGLLGGTIFYVDGMPNRYPSNTAFFTHQLPFNWDMEIRNPTCARSGDSNFPPECVENINPKLLVFGDSHAASLYAGMRRMQEKYTFGLSQYTQSGCPPLLVRDINSIRPNCRETNYEILKLIGKIEPDIVFVHGAYFSPYYKVDPASVPRLIGEMVEQINTASPESRILVIGPVPKWKRPLNRILFEQWRKNFFRLPPFYSREELESDFFNEDQNLAKAMRAKSIEYVSSYEVLCGQSGCRTHVGQGAGDLITYDGGHLSPNGALYLAEYIFEKYLNLDTFAKK